MPRLEKLLQRPQCATVGSALTQLLLDWAYLFKCVWTGGVGRGLHPPFQEGVDRGVDSGLGLAVYGGAGRLQS